MGPSRRPMAARVSTLVNGNTTSWAEASAVIGPSTSALADRPAPGPIIAMSGAKAVYAPR